MFLVTSVATLRERTSGTLERLLTMPIAKLDLLVGYALAFGLVAVVQATAAATLSVTLLGLDVAGPFWLLLVVAVLDALLGMALGLFVSAFAATEFQAVQFMPAFVLPQFLLCGLLVPRDQMPDVLYAVSSLLPLSYAVDAMRDVTTTPRSPLTRGRDLWRRRRRDRAGARSRSGNPATSYAVNCAAVSGRARRLLPGGDGLALRGS